MKKSDTKTGNSYLSIIILGKLNKNDDNLSNLTSILSFLDDESYLNFVKQKFGQNVAEHISDMTKIKLRRQLIESNLHAA